MTRLGELRRQAAWHRVQADEDLEHEDHAGASWHELEADTLDRLAEIVGQDEHATVTIDAVRASVLAERIDALADRPMIGAFRPRDATPFIDWAEFWERDHSEHEWLVDRVIARNRSHAIYAAKKVGKSLVTLSLVVELAVGHELVVVIYLDFEMTADDLHERLVDMGHGPATDLTRLRYWQLPALPPLDTPAGAAALLK